MLDLQCTILENNLYIKMYILNSMFHFNNIKQLFTQISLYTY